MGASMKSTDAAVVSLAGRAVKARPAEKRVESKTPRRKPTVKVVNMSAAQKRTFAQFLAAAAGAFLPVASFVLAHFETKGQPWMWLLVAAALLFSAPTLAEWAEKWSGSATKAWGFCVLLEGVMIAAQNQWLAVGGLVILVGINAQSAWTLAGKWQQAQGKG